MFWRLFKINFEAEGLYEAMGDASMIRQVWANLISNAVKFSAKSESPRIRVSYTQNNGGKGGLLLVYTACPRLKTG